MRALQDAEGQVWQVEIQKIQMEPILNRCLANERLADRKSPCSNCISWKAQCIYPSPIRRCHRPSKIAKPGADQAEAAPEANGQSALDERLKALEAALSQLSLLVGQSSPCMSEAVGSVGSSGRNESDSANDDVVTALENRVNEISSYLLPQIPTVEVSDFEKHTTPLPSSVRWSHLDNNLDSLLLNQAQAAAVWRHFREITDQQVKIVHRPQAELTLFRVYTSYASPSSSEVAFIFAIYFAALVGMSSEDVAASLGMCKSTAISTYHQAAQQAVMKAVSSSSQNLMALQAVTILAAFSGYVKDDKKAWPLTGMARRLNPASSVNAGTAFEMEIRRRIWWQLWYLDHRATINNGEEAEVRYTSGPPDLPANVLDVDLDPGMKVIPPSRDSWTPMSFPLMIFTMGQTALAIDNSTNWNHRRALIDDCASRVQMKYLRHCTMTEPIHWLAVHVAYVHFTELRIMLHGKRNRQAITPAQSVDRDRLVVDVTDILDVPNRLRNEPQAHKWLWTLDSFPHFAHLSFLLDEISQLQILPPPSHLWVIAEQAFSRAEIAMPASVKNKQVLRFSKKKAEDCLQLLLEWQRAADEVENTTQIQMCSSAGFGEIDVPSNPISDMLGLSTNMDAQQSLFASFGPDNVGLDSALLDLGEFDSNLCAD